MSWGAAVGVHLKEGGQQGRRQGSVGKDMLASPEDADLTEALESRQVASLLTRFAGDMHAGGC